MSAGLDCGASKLTIVELLFSPKRALRKKLSGRARLVLRAVSVPLALHCMELAALEAICRKLTT
jgi:hypothetical protein